MPKFKDIMNVLSRADEYFAEGKRLYDMAKGNYRDAKDTFSTTEQSQLDAKLEEVHKRAEGVNSAIQAQD